MNQILNQPDFDLDIIYRELLTVVHRAYVFMRFGHRGISLSDFDETRLPGSLQIMVVPEPMPAEVLKEYTEQYKSWVLGNGVRDLVEAFAHFLDGIYEIGLALTSSPDPARKLRKCEAASLRSKVQLLKAEFQIEGVFAQHFDTFTAARNALAHGRGVVRKKHCNVDDALVITWQGLDDRFLATDGNRYEPNGRPEGIEFVEPLDQERPLREKCWKIGERVELSARDLAEITFMANYEAVDVTDAFCEFAMAQGVTLKPVTIIRGGSAE